MSYARMIRAELDANRGVKSTKVRITSHMSRSSSAWDEVADVRRGVKKEFVKTDYLYRSKEAAVQEDTYADLRDCMI